MDNFFHLRRGYGRVKRSAKISMRIDPDIYKWIKSNNLSPTRIFDDAIFKLRKRIR